MCELTTTGHLLNGSSRDEPDQDWIRTEAIFGRIRTGSDCNLLKNSGSGLDRTEKYFVLSMREHIKILAVIRFYRFAK